MNEMNTNANIRSYKELRVYENAMNLAMELFHITKTFPKEEKYSLVDQVRRSSRSVCANLAEAWRKRRYEGASIAKLSDAETEASETQTWIEFSRRCKYLDDPKAQTLESAYNSIIAQLVTMIRNPHHWVIRGKS